MWVILASVTWNHKRFFLLLVSDHSAAFPEEKIEEYRALSETSVHGEGSTLTM